MKKIFLSLTILATIQLSAQEISCVEFVSMSDINANRYLSQFKRNIEIISDDTREGKKRYLDKNYQKTNHLYKCMLLREAKQSNIEDFKRVKSLAQLSKERLTREEKRLYDKFILENRNHFDNISKASLVSKNVCSYPLVYLSSQPTSKGLLIYEKRIVNNKIKTFNRYVVNSKSLKMQCGNTIKTQNGYLSYLNKNGASLPLIVQKNTTDIYTRLLQKQQQEEKVDVEEIFKTNFVVIKPFKAVNFKTGRKKQFKVGTQVLFEGEDASNGDKLFEYKNETYRVAPYTWKSKLQEQE